MLNAETVKAALDKAANDPDNAWAIMSSLIFDLAQRLDRLEGSHGKLYNGTVSLAKESRGMREALKQLIGSPDGSDAAAPQGDAQGASPQVVGAPAVETDAGPVTDPSLLAAELAMEEAAGPREGAAPIAQSTALVPRRQGGRPQVVGGGRRGGGAPKPRTGGDGQMITDPVQLAAEAAMDDAMGVGGGGE